MDLNSQRRIQFIQNNRRRVLSGQAMTELALLAPIIGGLLLIIIVLSGAVSEKMSLQAASAYGSRIGAINGHGLTTMVEGTSTNPIDQQVLTAVLATHGVNALNVRQILIYRAAPDGSVFVDTGGVSYVNAYNVISGTPQPASPYNWPMSLRRTTEPSDSIGVEVTYAYYPIVALPGVTSLQITDRSIQRLNPNASDVPCPVPGVPTDLVADPSTQPSSLDTVSWDANSGGTSYAVYASVDGAAYTTIFTGTVTPVAGRDSITYDRSAFAGNLRYAPTTYEVAGIDFCGIGNSSLAAPDGQCPLPIAPANLTATPAITIGIDQLDWTDNWVTYPVNQSYLITDTNAQNTNVYTQAIPPPQNTSGITDTAPTTGTDFVQYGPGINQYKVSAFNQCSVYSLPSNTASTTHWLDTLNIAAGSTTGVGSWGSDVGYSGGTVNTTSFGINTSAVSNPAPLGVYQGQRVGVTSTALVYTIAGMNPSTSFTLRLHFASINPPLTNNLFSIAVNGSIVSGYASFNPYVTAGSVFKKAVIVSTTAISTASGTIVITLTPTSGNQAIINGIELY